MIGRRQKFVWFLIALTVPAMATPVLPQDIKMHDNQPSVLLTGLPAFLQPNAVALGSRVQVAGKETVLLDGS
jgi:hypothetical protein